MDRTHLLAALAYIPGGFLLALLAGDREEFLRFHVRQGFAISVLAIVTMATAVAVAILTPIFLGIFLGFVLDTMLAFAMITGAWSAFQGQTWEMPIIGAYAKTVKL